MQRIPKLQQSEKKDLQQLQPSLNGSLHQKLHVEADGPRGELSPIPCTMNRGSPSVAQISQLLCRSWKRHKDTINTSLPFIKRQEEAFSTYVQKIEIAK